MSDASAADIRARLDHPIIDSDGHFIESIPTILENLREVVGPDAVSGLTRDPSWTAMLDSDRWSNTTEEERRQHWMVAAPWWGVPTRALDRAAALAPAILASRLDELGIDFTIVYPTLGNVMLNLGGDELRQGGCRALNTYLARVTRDHADRMTSPAIVPMYSPQEAIAELEYAIGTLGLRCIVIPDYVLRPVQGRDGRPGPSGEAAMRVDNYAIDSEHDYDPFWARCQELGVAVTSHGGSQGLGFRRSPSLYTYNHIGHFAAAHEAFAKALIFGGVTKRFPKLHFAFLEGGVGWAANLYSDLFEHWEKRGGPNIGKLDPEGVDWEEFWQLLTKGDGDQWADPERRSAVRQYQTGYPPELDDFSRSGIEKTEDIRDRFVPNFFFGCEADDRGAAWAFADRYHPLEVRLQAMLGSDLGHWDVADMREVIPDAYGLVEKGLLAAGDFLDFACDNAVRLHAGMNPEFFAGTRVESYVKEFLGRAPSSN